MGNAKRSAKKKKVLLIRTAAIVIPLIMSLVLLSQTAFAKNTYVITDGRRVLTYSTFSTDPAEVLGEAGLELDEGDSYTTQPGVGVSSITIQRGQDITIHYHGEKIPAVSYGETVGELLTRLNISVSENDVVSQPLELDTYDGMELRVDEVLHLEQTYTSTIPHEVTYCYDDTIPQGTEAVLVEGADGQLTCTATVTYINGQETGRVVHSQEISRQTVTEIVALGSAPVEQIDPGSMPVFGEDTITLPSGEVGDVVFVEGSRPDTAVDVDLEMMGVPEGFWAVPVETGIADDYFVEIKSGVEADTVVFTQMMTTEVWM